MRWNRYVHFKISVLYFKLPQEKLFNCCTLTCIESEKVKLFRKWKIEDISKTSLVLTKYILFHCAHKTFQSEVISSNCVNFYCRGLVMTSRSWVPLISESLKKITVDAPNEITSQKCSWNSLVWMCFKTQKSNWKICSCRRNIDFRYFRRQHQPPT